jgi:G:T-mismatch repair DNA endonuclease (very short patch repair protein)
LNNDNTPPICALDGCEKSTPLGSNGKGRVSKKYNKFCCRSHAAKHNSITTRDVSRDTCMKKYGVPVASMAESVKDTIKKTNLTRYGNTCSLHGEEQIEKKHKTYLRKYGVDHPMKCDDVKKAVANTNIERWGNSCVLRNETVKDKIGKTNLSKYGVINPFMSSDIQQNIVETNLKKYGFENPSQSPEIKEKIASTNLKKYGKKCYTQLNMSPSTIEIIDDCDKFSDLCKGKTSKEVSKILGVTISTVNRYARMYGSCLKRSVSFFQEEICHILEDCRVDLEINDREMLDGVEIDLYLPDYNIAIECNGTFWHSEIGPTKLKDNDGNFKQGKDKNYHLNKTRLCEEKGIQLIHVWEHDWNRNQELIKQRLLTKLGKNEKVYARKTQLKEISTEQSRDFLNQHHLQGTCPASVKYGLFVQDELVAVMIFGKSRFSKKYEWELLRYCSSKQVIGGASKLFKHFQREHNPTSVEAQIGKEIRIFRLKSNGMGKYASQRV